MIWISLCWLTFLFFFQIYLAPNHRIYPTNMALCHFRTIRKNHHHLQDLPRESHWQVEWSGLAMTMKMTKTPTTLLLPHLKKTAKNQDIGAETRPEEVQSKIWEIICLLQSEEKGTYSASPLIFPCSCFHYANYVFFLFFFSIGRKPIRSKSGRQSSTSLYSITTISSEENFQKLAASTSTEVTNTQQTKLETINIKEESVLQI